MLNDNRFVCSSNVIWLCICPRLKIASSVYLRTPVHVRRSLAFLPRHAAPGAEQSEWVAVHGPHGSSSFRTWILICLHDSALAPHSRPWFFQDAMLTKVLPELWSILLSTLTSLVCVSLHVLPSHVTSMLVAVHGPAAAAAAVICVSIAGIWI